jgi:tRNA guanosine-2'-O-methyltransferase
MGELFTSTVISTRTITQCMHGTLLANVVARYVAESPDTPSMALIVTSAESSSDSGLAHIVSTRRAVLQGILSFILDAEGKIFHFSILYLLEGLVNGLQVCAGGLPLQSGFSGEEVDKVRRVSRLPGLPEVVGDLYSEYCCQLCHQVTPGWMVDPLPAYTQLRDKSLRLTQPVEQKDFLMDLESTSSDVAPLQPFLDELKETGHTSIQGDRYGPASRRLIHMLDGIDHKFVSYTDLYTILDAFWEEADRQQFRRSVAVNVPPLLFHPTCLRVCIEQLSAKPETTPAISVRILLSKAMLHLQRISEGKSYVLAVLAKSLRKAAFSCPESLSLLPFEDYLIRFCNVPPSTKPEFLFEIAAAGKLQQYQPHRTYASYYGEREWRAYATMIDLLQRFPKEQIGVAKQLLDRLLEPWKAQRAGIPIISKWKNVLQLQAILMLADYVIVESEANAYLDSFRHALILEAWPRYRFLLEWIIARIYYRFPGKTSSLLNDLAQLGDNSSTHIASLMKLAVLVAPYETEKFSVRLMTQLVPFAASSKVHIRHESNYAIPIVFDIALSRRWKSITDNSAFEALNAFIRRMDKFQSAPWTIRTLKLNAINDFTLVNIFQGQYLTIESPEKDRVAYEDFVALWKSDQESGIQIPPECIPLGKPLEVEPTTVQPVVKIATHPPVETASPTFFQTKSSFDIASLYPPFGPPSSQSLRPASVILVASLIDNPTNLGGLSRISESFGLEALYIDDLRKMAHKDFKATSVTSEKHFLIHELKHAAIMDFLVGKKREGYEIVGIEQTDRSGILGTEVGEAEGLHYKGMGTLPKKCVLVLGSEKGGITAEVLTVVDRCVEIKTVGVTRSLSRFMEEILRGRILTRGRRCTDCGRYRSV